MLARRKNSSSLFQSFVLLAVVVFSERRGYSAHILVHALAVPAKVQHLSTNQHSSTYDDCNRKSKKQRNLRNLIPIVACSSLTEIQRALSYYVKPGDDILQFGGQEHSALKDNNGSLGSITAIDMRSSEKKSGRCAQKNDSNDGCNGIVQRIELEQLEDWRKIVTDMITSESSSQNNWDIIILDIGAMTGNDLHMTALSMAQELLRTIATLANENSNHSPRVVLIKSKSMSSFARRLIHFQRLLDGTQLLPKHSALVRSSKPYVIATVGVGEYRRTIPSVVSSDDEILEVGCHFGRTTSILHSAAEKGFCLGVDIGPKIIQSARKQYPYVPFAMGDCWNTLDLLKLKYTTPVFHCNQLHRHPKSLGYDVVYADIGGLSGSDGLLESLSLVDSLSQGLQPKCIVIKSMCVNRLASQLRAFSDIWNQKIFMKSETATENVPFDLEVKSSNDW